MNNSPQLSSFLRALPPVEALRTEARRREELRLQEMSSLSISASKERCKTLAGFVREAWPVVEPESPYVHGWHIEAICQHLEAITYGRINRLLINVPPGTSKSLLCGVLWPAWEWGPAGLERMRYFTSSYTDNYVKRDARRMRDLILSEWYQQRWGDRVTLTRTGESSFENSATGWREGVPFTSMTAGRGHRVIIDDPHSVDTAESEAERIRVIRTFRESVTNRLINPKTSAIVIIMQRLHVGDVTGVAVALNLGYCHLMLPMEFEPDRRCTTSIGFTDPRTYEGELLCAERFPREVVDRDKAAMGSFATASQFQQRPTLREGGLFKRSWFKIIEAAPAATRWLRRWDLAATKEQVGSRAAYTVGLKLGRMPSGRFVVGNVARLRAEGQGVRRLIKDTARDDGPLVEIGFSIDPGQAGKVQVQDLTLMLTGYIVHSARETGDKVNRAGPIAAQAEAGNVDLIKGDWNEAFIEEACDFPGGMFKDQIDALSGAFAMMIGVGLFSTPEELFTIDPVRVVSMWTRVAAIDIAKTTVSVVWAAHDRGSDTVYIYDAYVAPRSDLAIHARQLRDRGTWIPVLFDMEGSGRGREEGEKMAHVLANLSAEILTAPLDEESAVESVATRLANGQLRVFAPLQNWFAEYRRYARDDKGEIVQDGAGLMRATGLIVSSGLGIAVTENRAMSDARGLDLAERDKSEYGRQNSTGY